MQCFMQNTPVGLNSPGFVASELRKLPNDEAGFEMKKKQDLK
jgi:hypothetical protein